MGIPSQLEIGLPILELLSDGKILDYNKMEKKLVKIFELTKDEQNTMKPSGLEHLFHNRIRWSIFFLGKKGLVDRPKMGSAKISEKGLKFLKTNPKKIKYPSDKKNRSSSKPIKKES